MPVRSNSSHSDLKPTSVTEKFTFEAQLPFDPLKFSCLVQSPRPEGLNVGAGFCIAMRPSRRDNPIFKNQHSDFSFTSQKPSSLFADEQTDFQTDLSSEAPAKYDLVNGDSCQKIDVQDDRDDEVRLREFLDDCIITHKGTVTVGNPAWLQRNDPFPVTETTISV